MRMIKNTLLATLLGLSMGKLGGAMIYSEGEVEGVSMRPTLEEGEYVRIDKVSKDYNYGDIVVYKKGEEKYIKRIIGKGGDRIKIEGGEVYRNGEKVEESYVKYKGGKDSEELIVKEGEYYVLGDNRVNSRDSRHYEERTIKGSKIIGKVLGVVERG